MGGARWCRTMIPATAILLFLLFFSNSVNSQVCSIDGESCKCETETGTIDLTNIANENMKESFRASYRNSYYIFNPCYGLSYGDSSCSTDTAVCQIASDAARSCGALSSEKIIVEGETVSVMYTGGKDGRRSAIYLICDKSANSPVFSAISDNHQEYIFNLRSKCVCPGASCKSKQKAAVAIGDAGIVLIVLFLVGVITYFVVGALIMKFKFQKNGLDLIPQRTFWFSLPYLIKDGVIFTISPVISLIKKDTGSSKYDSI